MSFLLLIIPADSYMFQHPPCERGIIFTYRIQRVCTHISAYAHTRCPANKRGCKQAGRGDRCCTLAGETSRNVAYAYDPRWQGERMTWEKKRRMKERIKKRRKKKRFTTESEACFSADAITSGRNVTQRTAQCNA